MTLIRENALLSFLILTKIMKFIKSVNLLIGVLLGDPCTVMIDLSRTTRTRATRA
jgi:hypothetical protein